MKRCTSCQTTVNDGAKFCSKCGGQSFEPIVEMPDVPTQPVNQAVMPDVPTQPVNQAVMPQTPRQPVNQAVMPQMPPQPAAGAVMPEPQKGKGKKGGKTVLFIILGVVAALIIAGVIIFFVKNKDNRPEGGKSTVDGNADEITVTEEEAGNGLGSSPIVFKRIGQVDDEDFRAYTNIIYKDDTEKYVVCDPFGNNNLGKTFYDYELFQKAKGLAFLQTDVGTNHTGLANINTGKVYIPYEATYIRQLNERFFKVYYSTGVTTDEENAVLCYNADLDYYSTYVVEDREWYSGYGKVYDIVKEDFVPGVEVTNSKDNIYAVGEYFAVYMSDEKQWTMYNIDGKPVTGFPDTSESGVSAVIFPAEYNEFKIGDEYVIYDKDANEVFRTKQSVRKMYDDGYYSVYDSDKEEYYLYRKDGTKLFEQGSRFNFNRIGSAFVFSQKKGSDTKYGLVDLEGNVILPADASLIDENRPATGFVCAYYGNSKYSLLFPDGYVLNLEEGVNDGCYIEEVTEGEEYKVFIFADEEYRTMNYERVYALSKFLIEVRDENGNYGVIDTFSGEMLLPCEYKTIDHSYANDCIYAKNQDGQWEIYATHENDYAAAEKVKRTVLTALDAAFKKEGITATVNLVTGEVTLKNDVLFALDKADLSDEGKAFLKKFMSAYTSVVLDKKYEGYIDSILIEGHTDSDGTREHNLELSQNRADNVLAYCLSAECGDNAALADMFSAVGIASDRPVLDENGAENKEASRRVSFTLLIMTQEISEEGE